MEVSRWTKRRRLFLVSLRVENHNVLLLVYFFNLILSFGSDIVDFDLNSNYVLTFQFNYATLISIFIFYFYCFRKFSNRKHKNMKSSYITMITNQS